MLRSGTAESTGAIFILVTPLPLSAPGGLPERKEHAKEFINAGGLVSANHARAATRTYARAFLENFNRLDRRKRGMKHAELKPGRRPAKERSRLPEDAPTYPANHRIRQEALIILHEGEFSAADIAQMIGEDTSHVTNHLRDLYDAGCIEFVGYQGKGNFKKAVYRAVKRPVVTDEEFQAMPLEGRQEALGVHLQWTLAEALASYRNRKMADDDTLCLISDEPNLDAEGQIELRRLLTACWNGESEVLTKLKSVQDIAGRAANRMAKSGETGTTVMVSLMAFERARPRITKGSSQVPISKR